MSESGLQRLWAPWRHEYFDRPKEGGCFICRAAACPADQDRQNLILVRGCDTLIMLNRYPYTVGALMVAPLAHTATLQEVPEEILLSLMRQVKAGLRILDRALHPAGFNIGINQGAAAGAGLEEHLHIHLVPRWNADTNFMTTIAETRVLAEALDMMYSRLSLIKET